MSLVTIKTTRKVVVIGWDKADVRGADVSIAVTLQDGTNHEVRTTRNDGEANLYFPQGFSGRVAVSVTGSHDGKVYGNLHVN